jgi:hypothetical protein
LQGAVGLDKLDAACLQLCCQADDKGDRIIGGIADLAQINRMGEDREVIPDTSEGIVLLVIEFPGLDKLIPNE